MSDRFTPFLDALTRLRGVRGALVVSAEDGLVISESVMGGLKSGALAAMGATLAARARELAGRSGFGTPSFLHLQGGEGSLLVVPGTDVVLVAVAGRDVPIGLLRLEMLRTAERLT